MYERISPKSAIFLVNATCVPSSEGQGAALLAKGFQGSNHHDVNAEAGLSMPSKI